MNLGRVVRQCGRRVLTDSLLKQVVETSRAFLEVCARAH
jgi:hypothetical protein